MVMDITPTRKVYATNSKAGYLEIQAKAIVMAMGCPRTYARTNPRSGEQTGGCVYRRNSATLGEHRGIYAGKGVCDTGFGRHWDDYGAAAYAGRRESATALWN